MIRRSLALLVALTLSGCAYPRYVSGTAPSYPAGYQPVMGGDATPWPAQPGALWGPQNVASIDVFYQPLSPHGRWLQSPRWGLVFVPNAPRGWRPYQNGQWFDGRFWMSGDPWGWATDHYGRWGYEDGLGWAWVPGTEWGPSWVAWREADDVVGWAPIPPQVSWNVGIGFGSGRGWDNWNSWHGPSWVWVPRQSLSLGGFGGRILPWNTGPTWWGRSRWQHSPYWGWNQPWDRNWGWRTPAWGANRPGWNGGWNGNRNPGWNRDWNRDGNWNRRDGWNRRDDRRDDGQHRPAPGRWTGREDRQPVTPPPGWNRERRRGDGSGGGWGNGGNWNGNRPGWRGGNGQPPVGQSPVGQPPIGQPPVASRPPLAPPSGTVTPPPPRGDGGWRDGNQSGNQGQYTRPAPSPPPATPAYRREGDHEYPR